MININTQLLSSHFLDSLGWAIVHSIWQGIIALSLVLLYKTIASNKSPASHYVVQMSCLGLCLISFITTFGIYYTLSEAGFSTALGTSHEEFLSTTDVAHTVQVLSMNENQFNINLNSLTPLVGVLWCVGFLFMATRYVGAFYTTQQLKEKGTTPASDIWVDRFLALAKNSGVTTKARLLISKHVDGPLTIGFFKPVVLVPASFLTALPRDQIEAILLHELAHIRRFDYLLNLIEVCIKTVLFYHPAIHIICRHIDEHREQACDDIAVSQTHNPHPLVLGLASLRLQEHKELAMTANDEETPLLFRLKRLTGPIEKQKRPEQIVFSVITAILIASLVIGSSSIAASIKTDDTIEENKHSKTPDESYDFETVTIDDRRITIKKFANGSRWVLVNDAWYDIDRNPEILKQLRSLPISPQAPSPDWCENCKLAGQHIYIDMSNFQAKMDQYFINMEYYMADMARYAQEVMNKKPRLEEIKRWEENLKKELKKNSILNKIDEEKYRWEKNFNQNLNQNINKNINTNLNKVLKKNAVVEKTNAIKANSETITHHSEIELKNKIVEMMLADGVISWSDDITALSNLSDEITINGNPVPSNLSGKYERVLENLGIHGELILQIPSERESLKRVKKAFNT